MNRELWDRYRRDPVAFAEDLVLPTPRGDVRFGDCMVDFQRERFARLAPDLAALLDRTEPACGRHWWEATKGASKDTDLAVAVVYLLAFARRAMSIQIGAADQAQAGELRKAAKLLIQANPWIGERVRVDKWRIQCLASGAEAEIIPCDVRGSHGSRPDMLILNELHAVSTTGYEFAQNLMDNADKMPAGVRVIATNAGFLGTWQWKWRELARESPRWYFHRYDQLAPWIRPEDAAEAERRNSRTRYQRLFMGIWVSAAGDAIDQADLDACLTMERPVAVAEPGWLYAAGLDLGIKRDHSALVIVGTVPGSGRVRLVDVQDWKPNVETGRVSLTAVRDAVIEAAKRYSLCYVGYDPHQAELMAQELEALGVPVVEVPFVGRTLDLMASTLMQAFRSRCLDLYPCPGLVEDLKRLTIAERRWGHKLESAADESGHADRAIALAIVLPVALATANEEVVVETGPIPEVVVT